MGFERLNTASRPRYVVDQIIRSIRDGTLRPGDRLPSEAKLAELTGVGRTSVREGLAALRLMGVVETRVGDGTYVRPAPDLDSLSTKIEETIALSEEAFQLQEARAAFETGIVWLLVKRWDEEREKKFDRLLNEMEEAARSERYEDYIRLHRSFHLLLARATGNAIVEKTERSFLEFMDHEGWQDLERRFYLPDRVEALEDSASVHRGIIDAIAAGDGALAAERMHAHFVNYEG